MDYLSLFVVPLFMITSVIYLVKGKKRYLELTLTVVGYFYLSLPLFGIVFWENEKLYIPRRYIPVEWNEPSDPLMRVLPELTYSFESDQTERLYTEADSLMGAGEYENAIEIYSEIIAIEPQNVDIYVDLANCYGYMDQPMEAITILDRAITINDSLPYLFNNRGAAYTMTSQKANAIVDFQRAIALDSSDYLSYINLALVYCHEDKFEEAWEAIQKAEKFGGGEMLDDMSPDIRAVAERWK